MIVDGNYGQALTLYQKAFEKTRGGFAVDFANAVVCAGKTKDFKRGFIFLDSLISKGVCESFLDSFAGFKPYRLQKSWTAFRASYAKKRESWFVPDTALILVLDSMTYWDQYFRLKEGSYKVFHDTIRVIDKRNIETYIGIIRNRGFPDEGTIGRCFPGTDLPAGIVLHHHCQAMSLKKETVKYDFTDDLLTAIHRGKAEPHKVAFLISMQGPDALKLAGWGVTQLESNGNTSKLMKFNYTLSEIKEIDNLRIVNGLEKLEDYYRKVSFTIQNPVAKEFIFNKYAQLNIFGGLDQETYTRTLNILTPVD